MSFQPDLHKLVQPAVLLPPSLQRSGLTLCFSFRAYLWIRHMFICIPRNLAPFPSCRQFLNSNSRGPTNTSKRERSLFNAGNRSIHSWYLNVDGALYVMQIAKVPVLEKGMLASSQSDCPHMETQRLISEGPSEAQLSLVLWQPDVCPHSLLPHEQTKWPEDYLGAGESVSYCKTGAGNWRSSLSFVEHSLHFTKTSGLLPLAPSSE